jgi:hypothetical protein
MSRARRIAALAVAGCLLVLLAEPNAGVPHDGRALASSTEAVADADVQARIGEVARAGNEQELAAALARLRRAVPEDTALVPQLALFLLTARGEREGMAPALIVSRLGVSRGAILRGVEPHLDTTDPALRAQLENLLGAVDQAADGSVDFGEIRALVAERGAPPSDALVRYMFRRAPAEAVAALATTGGDAGSAEGSAAVASVEATRGAFASASEAERRRAASALEDLSRHTDWPLRAYAAAVLREQPSLAGDAGDLLERLTSDPDRRVRELATEAAARAR